MAGGAAPSDALAGPSGLSRWMMWSALLLLGLVLAFGGWWLVRSDALADSEHQRIAHEVDIAARLIEQWPESVRSMAGGSLLRSRIDPIAPANEDLGWQRGARFVHPVLGKIVVDYSVASGTGCPAPEATMQAPAGTSGYVAFRDAKPRMIIAGTLRIADLWYADERARLPARAVPRFGKQVGPDYVASLFGPPSPGAPAASAICFKTVLPLDRVVDIGEAAPDLEKLLLVDRSGRLLAQLGGAPLPMTNVRELAPLRPAIELDQLLAAAESGLSGGKPVVVSPKTDNAASDRSAPVKVTVGGHQYFAYSRTLNLPRTFPATECSDAAAPAGEAPAGGAPPGAIGFGQTCLVIGLVPTQAVTAASLQLPPAVLTGFGLALALIVALLPVLKLRLIGSSDSLRRVEVVAIAVGSIAAVATAMLALLTAIALYHDERAEIDRARSVAAAMAADFHAEMMAMLALPVQVAPLDGADATADAPVEPATFTLHCQRPGTASVRPIRTDATPPVLVDDGDEGCWPIREASLLFGDSGAAWPGYRQLYNHGDGGGRTDIGDRRYFQAAMAGDSDGAVSRSSHAQLHDVVLADHYVVAAVRTRPDGINKAIVATPIDRRTIGDPQHGALIESFVPRSFLSPVLPAPMRFLVVDAGNPSLEVLFGSDPYRVDIDRLIDDVPSKRALAAIADVRCPSSVAVSETACTGRTASFAARYEGVPQRFVAQSLPGTPWVLLVYFPDNAIAEPVASAAVLAAGAWGGLVFVAALILTGFGTLWLRRGLWRWAWPSPGGAARYRRALRLVMLASGGALLACGFFLAVTDPVTASLRLGLALAMTLAIVVVVGRQLGRADSVVAAQRFLDPADERAFRNLAIALLIVVGAGPITALWCDARSSTFAMTDAGNGNAMVKSIGVNAKAHRAIMQAFGTMYDVPPRPVAVPAHAAPQPGLYARIGQDLHLSPDAERAWLQTSVTAKLHNWSFGQASATSLSCTRHEAGLRAAALAVVCRASALPSPAGGGEPVDSAAARLFAIVVLAIGLGTLLLAMLDSILRGLFGHGVPLEAVTYPGIRRGGDGRLKLPPKALVLNAPLALQLELLESWQAIDISDPLGTSESMTSNHVVVTGLALSLRNPALRVKSLELLEMLARRVDLANRAADRKRSAAVKAGAAVDAAAVPVPAAAQLIVMTDLSPLDRVLQAYETEQALAGTEREARAEEGRREQLRWSRLFEAFSTIGFRPVIKVSAWTADGITDQLTPDERRGIVTLVEEVRELPEVIIDSLIDTPDGRIAAYWKRHTRTRGYPFDPGLYHALYDRRVRLWARSVRPASAAAAIDYLRGTLIEHYQYAWIASSHAERVILDSLARGRTVNISTSFALRALIRRGLIKLSPIPQLINHSFAAFVLQAEKPMQIQAWRDEQPRSHWQQFSPLLLVILPVVIVGFAALASSSGDSVLGLLPLLLGSAPALIGTLTGSRKSA